ncbi:hypothetical protein NUU61_003288 [Penicillium alfredii]|uniref:Fungal lipase-type domain-containing protein n=1 Tax=Penicillium alfredii TaxID=1506179 RepID=A0A9W9FT24_9EURO|nr:uncharacterized protein NUU61_003288 [Penicillium alfredii]KAJ5105941.1 hypothetical protein NUU61_003288 [Penicillium alfredii]
MLFYSVFAGIALISYATAIPTLQSRATDGVIFIHSVEDPDAFAGLRRAAQLSSAAYTGCTSKAFDVKITKRIQDTLTDTQGYVGYSETEKKISVVMRGSTTMTDILNDINTTLVTPTLSGVQFPSGAKIMRGINRPWSAVHDTVISEVESLVKKYPDYILESTGHSLGGALTYISYVALASNFPGKETTSNSLAAFPIGNSAFAQFAGSLSGTMNRGNNIADGVPTTLLTLFIPENMYVTIPYSFEHYGTEYYSSGTERSCQKCEGQRDRSCSAGNGKLGVTSGHFSSFGISMGLAGCGIL